MSSSIKKITKWTELDTLRLYILYANPLELTKDDCKSVEDPQMKWETNRMWKEVEKEWGRVKLRAAISPGCLVTQNQ